MAEHQPTVRSRYATEEGFGRLLVAVYGVFAISALARAIFQTIAKFQHAPLAYLLSAFSALVYLVAALALGRGGRTGWRIALVAVLFELVGVLGIGALTVVEPGLFADTTVWSRFGQGYGYVPLVLPVVGLWWIFRSRRLV